MSYILLVEDNPVDIKRSHGFLEAVGQEIEVRVVTSATAALKVLSDAIEAGTELPKFVVLDLELDHESGFEILRFWKGSALDGKVPIMVWTILAEPEVQICKYFGVQAVVRKQDGMKAFAEAVRTVGGMSPSAATL